MVKDPQNITFEPINYKEMTVIDFCRMLSGQYVDMIVSIDSCIAKRNTKKYDIIPKLRIQQLILRGGN